MLLKTNVDFNLRYNEGWTALMIASNEGHINIVESLLKTKINVNFQSNDGWNALMISSYQDTKI